MQMPTDLQDGISLNLSIHFSPLVSFNGGPTVATTADQQPYANAGPVTVLADVALRYSSLSRVITAFLAGKRITISEGLLPVHIVAGTVEVTGTESGLLRLRAQFTGSFSGQITITGTPVYNEETKTVVLLHPKHHLETKNILLQGARLIFSRRIEKELKKAAAFSLAEGLAKAQSTVNEFMNREWAKGITGTGETSALRLLRLKADPAHLLLQASCSASLRVTIDGSAMNFKG